MMEIGFKGKIRYPWVTVSAFTCTKAECYCSRQANVSEKFSEEQIIP